MYVPPIPPLVLQRIARRAADLSSEVCCPFYVHLPRFSAPVATLSVAFCYFCVVT